MTTTSKDLAKHLGEFDQVFDAEDMQILGAAFDKAWEAVQASGVISPNDKVELVRAILAKHIIAAAKDGERDHSRLRDGALLALTPCMRVPETPPESPPFQNASGGVRIGEHRARQRRRAIFGNSPLRGGYAWNVRLYAGVTLMRGADSSKREENDETCSNRYRKRGLFGFNRLGGGRERTGQYQPKRLSR